MRSAISRLSWFAQSHESTPFQSVSAGFAPPFREPSRALDPMSSASALASRPAAAAPLRASVARRARRAATSTRAVAVDPDAANNAVAAPSSEPSSYGPYEYASVSSARASYCHTRSAHTGPDAIVASSSMSSLLKRLCPETDAPRAANGAAASPGSPHDACG